MTLEERSEQNQALLIDVLNGLSEIATKLADSLAIFDPHMGLRLREFVFYNDASVVFRWPNFPLQLPPFGRSIFDSLLHVAKTQQAKPASTGTTTYDIGILDQLGKLKPSHINPQWMVTTSVRNPLKLLAYDLCLVCNHQPRKLLRVVRRIQSATIWCTQRHEGLIRHLENAVKEQSKHADCLNAELALSALKLTRSSMCSPLSHTIGPVVMNVKALARTELTY